MRSISGRVEQKAFYKVLDLCSTSSRISMMALLSQEPRLELRWIRRTQASTISSIEVIEPKVT
jgi:hypothetical protein